MLTKNNNSEDYIKENIEKSEIEKLKSLIKVTVEKTSEEILSAKKNNNKINPFENESKD